MAKGLTACKDDVQASTRQKTGPPYPLRTQALHDIQKFGKPGQKIGR